MPKKIMLNAGDDPLKMDFTQGRPNYFFYFAVGLLVCGVAIFGCLIPMLLMSGVLG